MLNMIYERWFMTAKYARNRADGYRGECAVKKAIESVHSWAKYHYNNGESSAKRPCHVNNEEAVTVCRHFTTLGYTCTYKDYSEGEKWIEVKW